MNWLKLLQALLPFEEEIVPIFVHNPNSQRITAVIMAAQSAVPAIAASMMAQTQSTPPAPAITQPKLPGM